ncbi:hypothetical protein JCM9279_004662 [Rhodotorula babjevae]
MATRRSTRRSLANEQGVENDLSNRVGRSNAASTSLAVGKPPAQKAPVASTSTAGARRTAITTRAALGDKSAAANATAGARGKRPAFSDVTNAAKAKAGPSKVVVNKATTASSAAPPRRSYRTRSSTGGATSAVKEEAAADLDLAAADNADGDDQSDAMAIDDDSEAKPDVRVVKPLRRGAAGASAATIKAAASTSTAAAARRPLAAKRTNTSTSATTNARGAMAKAAAAAKATPAAVRVARKRREDAEARHRAAAAELEAALHLEEVELKRAAAAQQDELEVEEQRQVKKLRTSEPEYLRAQRDGDVDDEGEQAEDELDEEDDEEGPRMSKWETEVEARPKDYGWEDLDEGDEEDPLMVSAYVVEVYDYLRELELTTMPEPDYMSTQNEVTWKMRGILVDWLVEIHTKFRLLPETIFLAVNIIDRFLSVRVVSLVKFQLVGVTALFIAAKYEEVVCPSVQNFLYMTDGGYTDDEILKAERYVLGIIGFNLSYPNPINFLRRISKADGYDIHSRTMAKYLMEISIVDHRFMATPPSLIAAGASWLARKVLAKMPWDANLVHYSGYSEEELKPTAQLMLDYVVRTSPSLTAWAASAADGDESTVENPLELSPEDHEMEHPNFVKKYGAKKFFKASTAVRKWAENEYQPLDFYDRDSLAVTRRPVAATL